MSSETPLATALGEPQMGRQAEKERLVLKARIATLERRCASLEAEIREIEDLRAESLIELQEKDSTILDLRKNANQNRPIGVDHGLTAKVRAELDASGKTIKEKDEVIRELQKKVQTFRGLKEQNEELHDLTKSLLRGLENLLAVTENLTNNEAPRHERLCDLTESLKVCVQHARNRFDYLASKANKDPAPHAKKNADRASDESTAISEVYAKFVGLTRESSGDLQKARAVAADIRRKYSRLSESMRSPTQATSTQSSSVFSTRAPWAPSPSSANKILPPTGKATAKSSLAKTSLPSSQPMQQGKSAPNTRSKDTTASAGKEKPPVTDDQGFIQGPSGKAASAKRDLNQQPLKEQAASKNPYGLLHDDGQTLPELPVGREKSTDKQSLPVGREKSTDKQSLPVGREKSTDKQSLPSDPTPVNLTTRQQDKRADFASRHSISPKASREALFPESPLSKSLSAAKAAMPGTPPAAPRSMAQVTANPYPPSRLTPAQQASENYLLMLARKLEEAEEAEEAEKAKIKSKVPDSKKIANAAAGKVVKPGTPRPKTGSDEMDRITEMLGGRMGNWDESEESEHSNQDAKKASERHKADVRPPQANPESPRSPTGVGSSQSNQGGQVAGNVSESVGPAPTTAQKGQAVQKKSSALGEGAKVETPTDTSHDENSQGGDTAPVDTPVGTAMESTPAASGSAPPQELRGRKAAEDPPLYQAQSKPAKPSRKGKNKKFLS